jgi:protein-tyrosine phosphatase
LDDGPADIEGSVALARAAVAAGTCTIVATPHIRDDYPFPLEARDARLADVRRALGDAGVPLAVVAGGELSLSRAADLTDDELARVCLGAGSYLLVESPYSLVGEFLENAIFELQLRGFRPVLAHPERSPSFHGDLKRLAALVDRGVLVSITAGSMSGQFGRTVRRATAEMLAADLVHNVASDAHGAYGRGPGLLSAFDAADDDLRGIAAQARWYTGDVPAAMLAGEQLPPRPGRVGRRRGLRWRA